MNLIIWLAFAAVTLLATVFLGLREFHMLQLNGYKTPEHSWWMKKNFKRYIPLILLFIGQFALLAFPVIRRDGGVGDMEELNAKIVTGIVAFLGVMNLIIALLNKPGKKFKKPFKYTARVKRMLTTFFILIAIIIAGAYFAADRVQLYEAGSTTGRLYLWTHTYHVNLLPYILVGSALYLTPILVPLSNLINKPIEKIGRAHV